MVKAVKIRPRTLFQDVAAVAFGVALILPQSFYYGRPMLVAGAFFIWIILAMSTDLLNTIRRLKILLALPVIFLLIVQIHLFFGNVGYVDLFTAGPIYTILALIVFGYYQIHSPRRAKSIRIYIILILSIFVSKTIPLLINNMGISRILATGGNSELIQVLYKMGFMGYPQLYAIAIPFAVLLFTVFEIRSKLFRNCMVLSLIALGTIVVFSTLTLPIFCLLCNLIIFCILHFVLGEGTKRITIFTIVVFLALCAIPLVHYGADTFEPIRYVYDRAENIFTLGGASERREMFFSSLMAFIDNFLLGSGFTNETWRIGGHSSFIDNWAYFGAVGYLPLFAFQILITYYAFARLKISSNDYIGLANGLVWMLYWVISLFNPVTFGPFPIMLIFVDFISPRWIYKTELIQETEITDPGD